MEATGHAEIAVIKAKHASSVSDSRLISRPMNPALIPRNVRNSEKMCVGSGGAPGVARASALVRKL